MVQARIAKWPEVIEFGKIGDVERVAVAWKLQPVTTTSWDEMEMRGGISYARRGKALVVVTHGASTGR